VSDIILVFSRLTPLSVLDILVVALIFYFLLRLIQGTQAVQLLRGILLVVAGAILVTNVLKLTAFNWLIRNSLPALLIAIPVIFQPELRRALERLGRAGFLFGPPAREEELRAALEEICNAVRRLSEQRYGALIVLERETGLQKYVDTGVRLDALVSKELLLSIFYPYTVLHDGAVIVRGNRVVAAACVLPLAEGMVDRRLGTRHRAAVGITEESDALVLVVSEETGIISLAHNGRMIRHLDERRLRHILHSFYRPGWKELKTVAGKVQRARALAPNRVKSKEGRGVASNS